LTPAATRRRIPRMHPCAREARESCIPNIGGAPSGERGWRSRPCESCIASPRERPSRWRVPPAPLWSPPRALPVYDSGVPLSSEDNKDRPFIPDWGCDADMPFTPRSRGLNEHGVFSCAKCCLPAHKQGWGNPWEAEVGKKCPR